MEKITKRQEDVLNYIKKYVVKHGFPPSTREIGAALGLSSPATVHTHLKKLEDAGCIRKTNSKFRTIEIIGDNEYAEKNEELVKVPLLGKITCGNPIEAIETPDEWFDTGRVWLEEREDQAVEVILGGTVKQYYNHPSVIGWICSNETYHCMELDLDNDLDTINNVLNEVLHLLNK